MINEYDAVTAMKKFWLANRRMSDLKHSISGPFTAEEAVVERAVAVVTNKTRPVIITIFAADTREKAEEYARVHIAIAKPA